MTATVSLAWWLSTSNETPYRMKPITMSAPIARAKAAPMRPTIKHLDDPNVELTGELIIEVLRDVSWHLFPGLAPADASDTN
jgi:hypothetical protein